jgi:ABC-type molybdate transport system permease subunit
MSNEDLLRHWQRSELRAIPTLQLLSQHLLPGAMAMLGAAIAMLMNQNRARLDGRLRDNFLSTLAMVIMPTSLGALIGLVWGTNPDIITANQIKFGDFSLSLAVVAFFVGFVFEDVLNWLRRALLSTLENNASTKIVVKS